MKQLLQSSSRSSIIVGLHDRAFLLNPLKQGEYSELLPEMAKEDGKEQKNLTGSNGGKEEDTHTPAKPEFPASEVQAVAIWEKSDSSNEVWCAVARADKSLALYSVSAGEPQRSYRPTLVHRTPKRAACLTFAQAEGFGMIVVGDLVGDAAAYSLQQPNYSRLLLGHTASMITSVQTTTTTTTTTTAIQSNGQDNKSGANHRQLLLTADRDEKIRVSRFPQTFSIEGYLLGHKAFVTALAPTTIMLTDDNKNSDETTRHNLCVSCGGDDTVRLWSLDDFREMCKVEVDKGPDDQKAMPINLSNVLQSSDNRQVAVVCHGSKRVQIYNILVDPDTKLELVQTIDCTTNQPLAAVFVQTDTLVVLQSCATAAEEEEGDGNNDTGDDYLLVYKRGEDGHWTPETSYKTGLPQGIPMPKTVLETDPRTGQLKMEKIQETRGSKTLIPRNMVERIQKAKASRSRRKRKKRRGE